MSPAAQGVLVLVVTLLVLLTGAPVAFGLGAVGVAFLVLFQGPIRCRWRPRRSIRA